MLRWHFKGEKEQFEDVCKALEAFSKFEVEVDYYTELEDSDMPEFKKEEEGEKKEEGKEGKESETESEKEKLIQKNKNDQNNKNGNNNNNKNSKKKSDSGEENNVSPGIFVREPAYRVDHHEGKKVYKGPVHAGDVMTINIKVNRLNKVVGHVHAKKINFFKKERVSVILLADGDRAIIPLYNQFSNERQISMKTQLPTPNRPVKIKFKCVVQSDSYVGVDRDFEFEVEIGPRREVVLEETHEEDQEALENLMNNRVWGMGEGEDYSEDEGESEGEEGDEGRDQDEGDEEEEEFGDLEGDEGDYDDGESDDEID